VLVVMEQRQIILEEMHKIQFLDHLLNQCILMLVVVAVVLVVCSFLTAHLVIPAVAAVVVCGLPVVTVALEIIHHNLVHILLYQDTLEVLVTQVVDQD
tara:strand:+ start:166 stop:459 length:294 start_codon:yes stop_codon:yes gene_type:complete